MYLKCITAIKASRAVGRLRPNLLGIADVCTYPKIINFKTVTDGFSNPFPHL